ncbi:hypothetical protein [Streptomyces hirsutus]|uniref:hypothetical protein n=1 Tax=Streptomyces hirsutus TaxID=35620 RepID=UPI003690FD42
MINEAISAVETVIWGAVISAGLIAAGIAFLTVAAGYWTGRLIGWLYRRLRHRSAVTRMRKQPPPPPPGPQAVDDYLTIRHTWHQPTRKETP